MRTATITVIGKDKSGVIARVTQFLFQQGANIQALEEQVTRGQFSMTLQAEWSGDLPDGFDKGLRSLGKDLGMDIRAKVLRPKSKQRVGLFVSLEPHVLEGVLKEVDRGFLDMEPAVLVSNHRVWKDLAEARGIPFVHIPWTQRQKAEERALKVLDAHEVDFVVLARFMKILSPRFVWHYKNRIINIHPSLLPSFPGPQAYRQAYEHGVKVAGVTAHFVNMHLDEGPILAQESFPIRPSMSLKDVVAAGQRLETKAMIRAIKLYLSKRLDVHWGRVKEV